MSSHPRDLPEMEAGNLSSCPIEAEHPAISFLRLLDPSSHARFNVETFTDAKGADKPSPDPLLWRRPRLSIDDVVQILPKLTERNKRGAAIYVAVNEFDGPRKSSNLARVRGIHADLDGVDPNSMGLLRSVLQPTIEVQSSAESNQHWYWLLDDGETLAPDLAKSINQALVHYGADKAAVDVTRLLRLPGFRNLKTAKKDAE